jgi:soluble P-type ATPase
MNELDNFNFDLGDFDLDFDLDENFETRYIKPLYKKEVSDKYLKYSDAKKLAKKISLYENERIFAIINGSFIFGDFIEALIVEKNCHVKEMTISTLSMSINNVDSLKNLLDGGFVDKLNLIVSTFFFSHERQGTIKYIYDMLDIDNKLQLAVADTHCKTCIFEDYNNNFIVIHGSANLRSSANIEQIMIENNKVLYQFNYDYQLDIINKYKTINKSIRRNTLWQVVHPVQEVLQ